MKYELKIRKQNIAEKELLDDLVRVKDMISDRLTKNAYNKHGKFYSSTYEKRFGTWNKALEKAGIKDIHRTKLTEIDLFENIEAMWLYFGRQPKSSELRKPLSKYSMMPYKSKYGTWNNALLRFIEYVEANESENIVAVEKDFSQDNKLGEIVHKTKREISDRLRFRVLMRDGFACQACGNSPQLQRGVELHVDHIIPWSKGGETVIENLQTKCKQCNLGKGNAFIE